MGMELPSHKLECLILFNTQGLCFCFLHAAILKLTAASVKSVS